MALTVDDEISAMRRQWPNFQATTAGQSIVTFRGKLAPLRQIYEVHILYGPKFFLGRMHLCNRQPRVEILSPPLVERHPVTGMPVPHVYPNNDNPKSPLLCLYDPATDEWRPAATPVAETIVPWAAHWLACYEGWLATGTWTGGGRHPMRPKNDEAGGGRNPANDQHPDVSRRLANKVAMKVGTFGSSAILAHAMAKHRDCLDTAEWQFIYQRLVLADRIGQGREIFDSVDTVMTARDAA